MEITAVTTAVQSPTETDRRALSRWFITIAALVLAIVVWGAVVRLTGSGLSIPDWPLINGSLLPPFTEAGWQAVQEDYRQEAIRMNKPGFPPELTTSLFRTEFIIEWFHRALAALVGIALVTALVKAWRNKEIRAKLETNFYLLVVLLLAQAGLGGIVVKGALPALVVTTHLLTAYLFFSVLIWTGLTLTRSEKVVEGGSRSAGRTPLILGWSTVAALFLQVMFGGLVAGTGAASILNTFPAMEGSIIPPSDLLFSSAPDQPVSPVFVQFVHRWLPFIALGLFLYMRSATLRTPLKSRTTLMFRAATALFVLQILVGIGNLVMRAPVLLSSLHSAVALTLFGAMVVILHDLRYESGEAVLAESLS